MRINLIFYAILQEEISEKPILLEVESGCSAQDLIEFLSKKYPKSANILKVTRLAHEDEYVGKESILTDGGEYCLIPPVSGG